MQGSASCVAPTASAQVRLRPIGSTAARILDGVLAERQRVNREVTLLRGAEELERAGTLENLRIAAGRSNGTRRGMVFSDSDVYKWLEALAWETAREPDGELEALASETTELETGYPWSSSRTTRSPNPRIDAVRSCLALERGPVVYCFEAEDAPAGADLADIALQRGAEPTDSGPLPELGGMPGVSVAGVARDLDGWAQIEYIDVRELPPNGAAAPARPLAVPYFAWANRGAGGMRVRVPTSG